MTFRQVNVGRAQALFVMKEVDAQGNPAPGTLVYPTSSDAVRLAGDASFRQVAGFIEDPERVPGFSRTSRVFNGWDAGEFTIPVWIKPISAGTKPRVGPLFEALLGKETVNAGTDVKYTPHTLGEPFPTLSMAFRVGPIVYWVTGAVINQCRIRIEPRQILSAEFSGQMQKLIWAGPSKLTTAIDGSVTPVTDIPVDDPRNFTVDALVKVGTNDNGGQGFKVTQVDLTNNKIVVSPGVNTAEAQGAPVVPFLPTETDAGDLVAWRLGMLSETPSGGSAVNLPIIEGEVTVTNNAKILWDKADQDYPSAFSRSTRVVEANFSMYLGDSDVQYLRDVIDNREYDIKIPGGNTAGKIFEIHFPKALPRHPEHDFGIEELTLQRAFDIVASTVDDEIEITFK